MKTFNKKGDGGETSLLYGGRVPKSDPHCEAYGTVDEAVSALGLARALSEKKRVQEIVFSLQKDLFIVGAELATHCDQYDSFSKTFSPVASEMVQRLEDLIQGLEGEIEMPKSFVIPGASGASAALDLARAIIRRAERRAVSLKGDRQIENEEILRYLNRLGDLVFTLARYEEASSAP